MSNQIHHPVMFPVTKLFINISRFSKLVKCVKIVHSYKPGQCVCSLSLLHWRPILPGRVKDPSRDLATVADSENGNTVS